MGKNERKKAFTNFYQENYESSLNFVLEATGDFLNAEGLVEKIFNGVYRYFKKAKEISLAAAASCLVSGREAVIERYLKKQPDSEINLEEIGETIMLADFMELMIEIDEAVVEKKMLLQDILAYVSEKPLVQRRLFAIAVYYKKGIQETAEMLRISVDQAEQILGELLYELYEKYLAEFEQDIEE